jgi:hypothetical protein
MTPQLKQQALETMQEAWGIQQQPAQPPPAVPDALRDIFASSITDVSPQGQHVLHTAMEKLRQNHLYQPQETVRALVRALPADLINARTTEGLNHGLPASLCVLAQAASGNDHRDLRSDVVSTLLARRADVHVKDHNGL